MKLLFISKYPPTEGGVASQNYWLARALGERGFEVSVLTNALETEDMWREKMDLSDIATLKLHQPKNVFFYSLKEKPPFHIPYSDTYLSRLVNLGLKIIGERGADVLYAHYLEPYAAAGFILKKITGLPLVIRHAGSDIYRLFKSPDFRYFLGEVIAGADALIFSRTLLGISEALRINRKKIYSLPAWGIDTVEFGPEGAEFNFDKYGIEKPPRGVPVFDYLGKSSPNKGIEETLGALSRVRSDFRLLFVSNGKDAETFAARAASQKNLAGKFINVGFIPPWEVPALLRSSDAVLHLEHNFPVPIHSPRQPYEAVASGTPLIISGEIFKKMEPNFPNTKSLFTVVDDPGKMKELEAAFKAFIVSSEQFRVQAQKIREEYLSQNHWERFVDFYDSLFRSLVGRKRRFWRF